MDYKFTSLVICVHGIFISHLIVKLSGLEPHGCENGWHNFKEHCYSIVLNETTADGAIKSCSKHGADLASVWSESEMDFLITLWQFPRYILGFLWLGLRGTPEEKWKYVDGSEFKSGGGWSILDAVEDQPISSQNKCLVARPAFSPTFFDCTMYASAFACKKPLAKIYINQGSWNRSQLSPPSTPLTHAKSFHRVFPPRITSLPNPNIPAFLAQITVEDDVGCAYKCFSINECSAFEVTCISKTKCASSICYLFSNSHHFIRNQDSLKNGEK